MNEANIKYAIEVMKNAQNLNMCSFQSCNQGGDSLFSTNLVKTVEELHACGNTACFIGYLCLTESWKGYFKNKYGEANFNTSGDVELDNGVLIDSYALSDYLGINEDLAHSLIFNYSGNVEVFYSVPFKDVKPEHVIEKLEQILSGELV